MAKPKVKEIATITIQASPAYALFLSRYLHGLLPEVPVSDDPHLQVVVRGYAAGETFAGATVTVLSSGAILRKIALPGADSELDGRSAYRWLWDTLELLLPDGLYADLRAGYRSRQARSFASWKERRRG